MNMENISVRQDGGDLTNKPSIRVRAFASERNFNSSGVFRDKNPANPLTTTTHNTCQKNDHPYSMSNTSLASIRANVPVANVAPIYPQRENTNPKMRTKTTPINVEISAHSAFNKKIEELLRNNQVQHGNLPVPPPPANDLATFNFSNSDTLQKGNSNTVNTLQSTHIARYPVPSTNNVKCYVSRKVIKEIYTPPNNGPLVTHLKILPRAPQENHVSQVPQSLNTQSNNAQVNTSSESNRPSVIYPTVEQSKTDFCPCIDRVLSQMPMMYNTQINNNQLHSSSESVVPHPQMSSIAPCKNNCGSSFKNASTLLQSSNSQSNNRQVNDSSEFNRPGVQISVVSRSQNINNCDVSSRNEPQNVSSSNQLNTSDPNSLKTHVQNNFVQAISGTTRNQTLSEQNGITLKSLLVESNLEVRPVQIIGKDVVSRESIEKEENVTIHSKIQDTSKINTNQTNLIQPSSDKLAPPRNIPLVEIVDEEIVGSNTGTSSSAKTLSVMKPCFVKLQRLKLVDRLAATVPRVVEEETILCEGCGRLLTLDQFWKNAKNNDLRCSYCIVTSVNREKSYKELVNEVSTSFLELLDSDDDDREIVTKLAKSLITGQKSGNTPSKKKTARTTANERIVLKLKRKRKSTNESPGQFSCKK